MTFTLLSASSQVASAEVGGFSNTQLQGTYRISWNFGPRVASIGHLIFDGKGSFTGRESMFDGIVEQRFEVSGVYNVDSNGSGIAKVAFSTSSGVKETLLVNLAIQQTEEVSSAQLAKEIHFIQTDENAEEILVGVANRTSAKPL